mgnify:CR=1 FL=1
MPSRYLLPLIAIFAVTLAGIAWLLINFTDSNVPWLDSFTTALSIVGMWMLARKYGRTMVGLDWRRCCEYRIVHL